MSKNNNGGPCVQRNQEHTYDPVRSLNRMVSEPYYLFHLLVFFSYIPIRFSASQLLSPARNSFLLKREIQVFVAYCVLAVVKIVKTESWESFIHDTLFFAKIFLTAIALVLDYHLALWYTLAFLVIHIIAQQPPYEGLGSSNHLTPLQLETLLTEGNTSRFWLVEFRAFSTPACVCTSSFFPELSITYSNANLSFGTVDIGLFPNAAEKIGIPLGSLNQLPVYILFENAIEVARFPEFDSEPYVFGPTITKKLLCGRFELDKRLLDYVNGK
ncbi:uncharacterized protein LOC107779830 [Nicotiana tabacum]|uniref:Thioredoxin-related transmembrane protein 2 n=2 Tax=Nicotiana TaxID=4085 RepID=A0A1S3YUB1_TOBAC|nr:PREDICTED: thioredoxin-related transmembrane protein 2 [Nicotiana sylvestris]XP_016455814.1 PREDICTED: thioredoxin-related transmembrane protein 2 [Nicotiana tabacum]